MRLFLHFAAFSALALGGVSPQLERVQSVYILPMRGGMDQYLANRIAGLGKMQVVTDPQNADAILTDRIGEPFEKRLDGLYGARKKELVKAEDSAPALDEKTTAEDMPVKSAPTDKATNPEIAKPVTTPAETNKLATTKTDTSKTESAKADAAAAKALSDAKKKAAQDSADMESEQMSHISSFGRGKGTFFLVDRRTRSVVWSVYEKPKDTSADQLEKTAERVVNRLKRDLTPKAQN